MRFPYNSNNGKRLTAEKVLKYGVFSGPYFPTFGLNTEKYEVSLRIQSECRKIRIRKNFVFGHISHSDYIVGPWYNVPSDTSEAYLEFSRTSTM